VNGIIILVRRSLEHDSSFFDIKEEASRKDEEGGKVRRPDIQAFSMRHRGLLSRFSSHVCQDRRAAWLAV
jgi:hypothetical protein